MSHGMGTGGGMDPHGGMEVVRAGVPVEQARGVLILLHGRGGTAGGMVELFEGVGVNGVAAMAPRAAGGSWYPQSFLAPLEMNQPWLDSALKAVEAAMED